MKKRKTNQLKLWVIVVVMAIFLLVAAPSAQAVDYNGGVYDVMDDVDFMNIWDNTTVNLYADVLDYVYIDPGGIMNFYSGNVTSFIALLKDGTNYQTVTVYGTDFFVDNVPVPEGAGQFTPALFVGSTLTGTYGNGTLIDLWFISDIPIYLQPPVSEEEVEIIIDIKPGDNPNSINLKSRGVVPVAVLTTDEFNAGTLVPNTVIFAGAKPVRSTLCDVDEDGDMDMLFHFKTQDLVELNEDSTTATLTGETTDGQQIEATDQVRIVPCGEKKKNHYFSDCENKKKYSYFSYRKHKFSKRNTTKHEQPKRNHKDR